MKENKKGRNTLYWGVSIVAAIALAVVLFVLKHSIWMALGGAVGLMVAAALLRSFLDMSYFRKLGKQVDAITCAYTNIFETEQIPDTGDHVPMMFFAVMMVVSGALLMMLKKRQHT